MSTFACQSQGGGSRKNSLDSGYSGSSGDPQLRIKTPQTCVQVYLQDGVSSHFMVDDQLTAGQLCQQMMKRRNVPLITSWSIIEHLPDMFIERRIERHEVILEVIRNWVKGSNNRLLFVENVDRYALYDSEQQEKIGPVYNLEGSLHVKSEEKKIWKRLDCMMQSTGLCYLSATGKGKSEVVCLQSLADVDVYMAVGWRKKYKSPTEFGIALKPAYVQKKSPKCVKYLCADDLISFVRWMTALRLAKYGRLLNNVSKGPQLSSNRDSIEFSGSGDSSSSGTSCSGGAFDENGGSISPATSSSALHRRKASVVATLPISTQTTRLLSQQQSRTHSGIRDETDLQVSSPSHLSSLTLGRSGGALTSARLSAMSSSIERLANCCNGEFPPPPSPSVFDSSTNRAAEPQMTLNGSPSSRPGMQRQSSGTLPRCAMPPLSPLPAAASSPACSKTMTSISSPPGHPSNGVLNCSSPPPFTCSPPVVAGLSTTVSTNGGSGSPARAKPPPPKRNENTKLSFSAADQRQTRTFILNLDRVIAQKGSKGCAGLATLPVPLPPRPVYVEGPTYLDTDDLPPPPAELLEGLRVMRRQLTPLMPIPPANTIRQ